MGYVLLAVVRQRFSVLSQYLYGGKRQNWNRRYVCTLSEFEAAVTAAHKDLKSYKVRLLSPSPLHFGFVQVARELRVGWWRVHR